MNYDVNPQFFSYLNEKKKFRITKVDEQSDAVLFTSNPLIYCYYNYAYCKLV